MIVRLLYIFSFFAVTMSYAQDLEEQQDPIVAEGQLRNIMTFDVKGIYQLSDKTCKKENGNNFVPVKFSNGELAYDKKLRNNINESLSSATYYANGNFYIDLNIDKTGLITAVNPGPKIDNARYFYEDLKNAIKKTKETYTPAHCNGTAVNSIVRIKLQFDSITFEN